RPEGKEHAEQDPSRAESDEHGRRRQARRAGSGCCLQGSRLGRAPRSLSNAAVPGSRDCEEGRRSRGRRKMTDGARAIGNFSGAPPPADGTNSDWISPAVARKRITSPPRLYLENPRPALV